MSKTNKNKVSKANPTDKGKPRTQADSLFKEARVNLCKALECFKAACESVHELLIHVQRIPTTPQEALGRLAAALGEPPAHIRRAAAEVRAEYGYKPENGEQPQKPAPAKKPAAKKTVAKKTVASTKPAAKKPAAPVKDRPTTDDQAGKPIEEKVLPVKGVSSVHMTQSSITLNIGAQPVKELAETDAKDFLNNQKVFWYRPVQFPDPRRYRVQPRVESAKPIKRTSAKFTRSPWTTSVTISATGDSAKCEAWLRALLSKNRSEQE